ncbi:DUF1810 domain-containing protein [Pseudomonas chlororaphis]|uniref:DUF1810 domain-containing protein n=1 Tax=Pseudomonas chlororaphis TaxID=587753 RepID=UPI000BE28B3A|nr:DUF1810 family protein [Pseudomonas chlororaphis]
MTESLERFVQAQVSNYELAMHELECGRKDGHWMWFIFPQLRGLGTSEKATYYGLRSIEEAHDYLEHPLLGPRLDQATRVVLNSKVSVKQLFGELDALKFASCMTLFAAVSGCDSLYARALDSGIQVDLKTREILKGAKK